MTVSVAEEEVQPLPAIFEHAKNVYNEMERTAVLYTPPEGTPGEARLVWEGHLTKLITGAPLHLSVPYYTSVTRELKRMGCIRQLRRGGGNAPSQWLLLTAPTEELFRSEHNKTGNMTARRRDRIAALEQRVADRDQIIAEIQTNYEAILDILHERENRA
jgi:hypothetical protein